MFKGNGWEITKTNYQEIAEEVMEKIAKNSKGRDGKVRFQLTTSKIRGLLTLVNQIYNEIVILDKEELSEDHNSKINYLGVRMVYEAGRETGTDKSVKEFIHESHLLEMVKQVKGEKERFLLFSRYFEALVAYHRFLGGQD